MSDLRVLHLIPSLGGGGAERQLAYLARGLGQVGIEVHVGMLHEGNNLQRLIDSGAAIHRIHGRSHYDPLLVPRVAALIRGIRANVVQTWLTQMDVVGGIAAMLTRTPWLLSERASPAAYPRDMKNRLRTLVGRFADGVIANSAPGLDVWKHNSALPFVVPNAIPFDEIAATRPAEEVAAPGTKVVLFAARLAWEKNLTNLFTALTRVVARGDTVAVICGEGPLEAEVRRMIVASGRGDRIRLLGFVPHLWSLMKRADVLVSVSWAEGQANVVLEAIAADCPVVVSEIPEHRAYLDETSALFAAPDQPAAIASAILRTLDDPEAARARVANARRIVEQWSIERAAAAYAHIYRAVSRTG